MSRKGSVIEDYLSKSSLFKSDKNKIHSSSITHEQYFNKTRDQRVSTTQPIDHRNMSQTQYLFPRKLNQRSKMESQKSQAQPKYSQIYPEKRLQDRIQQNEQKQKRRLVSTVEKRIMELQQLQKQEEAKKAQERQLRLQSQVKPYNHELKQDESIEIEKEPHIPKTESQQQQEFTLSPSGKHSSQYQNCQTINIIISPDPKLKREQILKESADKYAQTSQIYKSLMEQSRRKSIREIWPNKLERSSAKPESSNPQPRKNRSYNYNEMSMTQSNKKHETFSKNQNLSISRRKYYDQIINEKHFQNLRGNYGMEDLSRKLNFFSATQREAQNYVNSIQLQLKEASLSLSNIQSQIDALIFHNLEVQCQKIRVLFMRAIENCLNRFKEAQKRRLQNSKIQFIGELYEIQSSIEHRREEVSRLKFSFQKQNQWKSAVSELLTHNFEQNVEFLIAKSRQIQMQWLNNTNQFMVTYNHQISQNIQKGIKNDVQSIIERVFSRFSGQKDGSPQKKYKIQNQMEGKRHRPLE